MKTIFASKRYEIRKCKSGNCIIINKQVADFVAKKDSVRPALFSHQEAMMYVIEKEAENA